jgi:hypothetical protein
MLAPTPTMHKAVVPSIAWRTRALPSQRRAEPASAPSGAIAPTMRQLCPVAGSASIPVSRALAWWPATARDPYALIMLIALAWLRLDLRRRRRSLVVLALLVAVSAAVVLTAFAGARRGASAFDRLWAQTLPATVAVLPNEPGFNWAPVGALPEVAAMGLFPVFGGVSVEELPGASVTFFPASAAMGTTVERPVVLRGRAANPARLDEVTVSSNFIRWSGKDVGATLTLRLASVAQADEYAVSGTDPARLLGPEIKVRIVGVTRSPFWLDQLGDNGGLFPTPAIFSRYRAEIMGTKGLGHINALIRLKGGAAQMPAFRADLARVSGRSDIDVWDNYEVLGGPSRTVDDYEAACLLAFGIAALLAALFLVGQSVGRHVSGAVGELRVLRAVGMTRREAVACASGGLVLAAVLGSGAGVAAAIVASRWLPLGYASVTEPRPGMDADWLVLGPGWAAAVALVLAGATAAAWRAFGVPAGGALPRRSAVAAAAARLRLPVPALVGARFALEPGRDAASAVPVRSAILGAIAGVLGVLAVLTFSAGVSDAATHPERFGATWQLTTFFGLSGQDFGPATAVARAVAADRDVAGFLDVRFNGAQSGRVSVESFAFDPVDGKSAVPVVLTAGRMPGTADEIVLAPVSARALGAGVGSTVRLSGGAGPPKAMTVTGVGFVPSGPHNDYSAGAWLTPAGYDRLFAGARYPFKFHAALVTLTPGADPATVARRLDATAMTVKGGAAFPFTPPDPVPGMQELTDLSVLPTALAAFLTLLAVAAVGHALALAVRRRRRELAVLRTLGFTRRQSRLVIITQASLLAGAGLAFGMPLGVAVGRAIWRAVAGFVPLAYQPPVAVWALVLAVPVTLLAANVLALWPARSAARLRPGQILRAE